MEYSRSKFVKIVCQGYELQRRIMLSLRIDSTLEHGGEREGERSKMLEREKVVHGRSYRQLTPSLSPSLHIQTD